MANTLLLTGRLMNLLARGVTTATPAAESARPLSALYDGDPGLPFRHGSNPTSPRIDCDADLLAGAGDFETWASGTPAGWTEANTGDGAVVQDTDAGDIPTGGGASSAAFSASAGSTALIRKVTLDVRSGERAQVRAYLKSNGSDPIRVYVQNPRSGRWLKTDATWQAAQTHALTRSAATFGSRLELSFTVESWAALAGLDICTLEVTVSLAGVGAGITAWADRVEVVPGSTFLGVSGHNLDPVHIDYEVLGAEDAAMAESLVTLADAIAIAQPTFYAKWAESFKRFLRVRANGTANSSTAGAVWYGEMILGNPLVLSRNSDYPIQTGHRLPQIRNRNAAAGQFVYPQGKELRTITLPYSYRNATQYAEARNEILRRGNYGAHPTVIVPQDDEPDVILCRKDEADWMPSRQFVTRWEAPLTLEEMAIADVS